jgi:hypothetical protein
MVYLMFASALSLSAIAAWYSIAGLTAIFAAAVVPIIIMGSALEISKLVVASWLYRNWKEVPGLLKSYFTVALIILMVLTSMGIFGYLSKAHLDQATPSGNVEAKLENIEDKIQYQKEIINENRTAIDQLASQISKYTELGAVSRGVKVRQAQAEEREQLQLSTQNAQTKIEQLNKEKYEISKELRTIEAEVGPLKYIAALIYGDNPDSNLLERAVRIVILMIVAVFDPLAVLMLVAANWSLKNKKHIKPEDDVEHLSMHKFFDDGKELAKTIDENNGYYQTQEDIDNSNWENIWNIDWDDNWGKELKPESNVEPEIKVEEPINPVDRDYQEYLNNKKEWEEVFNSIENPQSTIEEEVDEIQKVYGISMNEIDYDPKTKKTYKKNKKPNI